MLFVDYVIRSKKTALYDLICKCEINKRNREIEEFEEINLLDDDKLKKAHDQYEQRKLNNIKTKSLSLIYDLSLCFDELVFLKIKALYVTKVINDCLVNINDINTLPELKDLLNNLYEKLDVYCRNISDSLNKYCFTTNVSEYNEEVNVNPRIIQGMLSKINSSRKINIFDTKCRKGATLDYAKNLFVCNAYGLEIINDDAEEAKKVATKIIKGDLPRCNITNNVFDIIISTSSLSFDRDDNISLDRLEKIETKYLEQCYRYLNKAGILIFVIPAFRMHKDICMYLSKRFENIYFCKDKNDTNNLVYIIGQKKSYSLDLNQELFQKLRSFYNYSSIPNFTLNDIPNYTIKSNFTKVKTIKGSITDYDEFYNITNDSGLMEEFFNSQKVEKLQEVTQRPLLPFNLGQLGLVITSGKLDGLVDEGNGCCHLIKGRVAKKIRKKDDVDLTRRTVIKTEIYTNNVEINALLPNGEFKNLA